MQLELYYKFLQAQAEGFDGAFDEFVSKEVAQPVIDSLPEEDIPEEVLAPTASAHKAQLLHLFHYVFPCCLILFEAKASFGKHECVLNRALQQSFFVFFCLTDAHTCMSSTML